MRFTFILAAATCLTQINQGAIITTNNEGQELSNRLSPEDPSSYSRPDIAKLTHIHMKLNVDFDMEVFGGSVELDIEKVDPNATEIIMDARGLNIRKMFDINSGKKLDYILHKEGFAGSKLEIMLPTSNSKKLKIQIDYETSPNATGLQWLSPAKTIGKTHPYVFSQCQGHHCRSILPCQDTPVVKMTYSAEITAPADFTVLMSAVRVEEPQLYHGYQDTRVHRFEQNIPIQSYLIAFAVGKLESRKIGPRSHVWSEKENVDAAAFEFAETETMIQTAEELCGPYVWGTYDILVLPPSFPYGGMENPCLTFASSTLLAGDRSQAYVIAHEIAHSWTGNLVTNKNPEHFWLNEGFTVFTEQKIQGRMFGEPHRHLSAILITRGLENTIKDMGENGPFTSLVTNLTGINPDEAYNLTPYAKGSIFLWYLEETVGGPDVFEPFLRSYYEHFKFKSIDSNQFKEYFLNYFKESNNLSDIDWDTWLYGRGTPIWQPDYDQSLVETVTELRKKWVDWKPLIKSSNDFTSKDTKSLPSPQIMEFLNQLLIEEPLGIEKLEEMEKLYNFNSNNNPEVKYRWIRLGLKSNWDNAIPRAIKMVSEQGRMKYLNPIYRDLYNNEDTRQIALDTYEQNKASYMSVAKEKLMKILKLQKK